MRYFVAAMLVVCVACSHDSFPKQSASAKWIDETDAMFLQSAKSLVAGLKKQPERWKATGSDKMSERELVDTLANDIGVSFMEWAKRTMPEHDYGKLRGIVSRKVADDRWLQDHRDFLDKNRAEEIVAVSVRIGAFNTKNSSGAIAK
jgi:hypothetical protein